MNELDKKINKYFPEVIVRKDLSRAAQYDTTVPHYVIEHLIRQYCANGDELSTKDDISKIGTLLLKYCIRKSESDLIRLDIDKQEQYRIVDKVRVSLNPEHDVYEAKFLNLNIEKVLISSRTVKEYSELLTTDVWCIIDVDYEFSEYGRDNPWVLSDLQPLRLLQFDFGAHVFDREYFSTDEWLDLLMQSIGLNPAMLNRREKLIRLIRLIPFCEASYNLIELGPKGVGKTHMYSEFLSLVKNPRGKISVVGCWDCVTYDEFSDEQNHKNKTLVDIMKNHINDKSFLGSAEILSAEASIIFMGNTQNTVPYMLKYSNLFCDLPKGFYDSALLDRMHCYLPSWEMKTIQDEDLSDGYGFLVDYLAEMLRILRNSRDNYSELYKEYFTLSVDMSKRDRDSINKTFSGLMKIVFPNKQASEEEIEELLCLAIEGRKRVKDQLMRIDHTRSKVHFAYFDSSGACRTVSTAEERAHPRDYDQTTTEEATEDFIDTALQNTAQNAAQMIFARSLSVDLFPKTFPVAFKMAPAVSTADTAQVSADPVLKEEHLAFKEDQTGLSFKSLFGHYLKGATKITVTDPYIRLFYQQRNFMEFLEVIIRAKSEEKEVSVHLITVPDEFKSREQISNFEKMRDSALELGVYFTWEFSEHGTIHARHIVTDHGWKITLDRGLDIFQPYATREAFHFMNRMQRCRSCKAFEMTFIKIDEEDSSDS